MKSLCIYDGDDDNNKIGNDAQVLYVGATVPDRGPRSVDVIIKKLSPKAVRVSSGRCGLYCIFELN